MRTATLLKAATLAAAVVVAGYLVLSVVGSERPIAVGVLQSLSGTMAISEKSLVDAVQLSIEELNRSGGVLGRSAEEELKSLPREEMAGDYAAWTYFESVDAPLNDRFVQAFKRKYGDDRVTDDPIEVSYVAVKLWARAVEAAGTPEVGAVRAAIVNRSLQGPGGMVFVDGETRHAWKTVRIGRVRADGQFDLVWTSGRPIRPEPFPAGRSVAEWNGFLEGLYKNWGSRWYNPG